MDRATSLAESRAGQLAITATFSGSCATIALIGELDIAVVADAKSSGSSLPVKGSQPCILTPLA